MSALTTLRALVDEASVAFQMSLRAHNDGALVVADALTERGYELIAEARALVAAIPIEVAYHHRGHVGVISALDPYAPTQWLRIWNERNSTHATVQWHQVAEDNYRRRLEVEIVHHETAEVDGERVPVVRFTGWTDGGHVVRGWAHRPNTQVLVVADMGGNCFQTLIGDTHLL